MGRSCAVKGCKSRQDDGLRFFRIPTVKQQQGAILQQLSLARRKKWLNNIDRKELILDCKEARICSKHFHGNKPYIDFNVWNPFSYYFFYRNTIKRQ